MLLYLIRNSIGTSGLGCFQTMFATYYNFTRSFWIIRYKRPRPLDSRLGGSGSIDTGQEPSEWRWIRAKKKKKEKEKEKEKEEKDQHHLHHDQLTSKNEEDDQDRDSWSIWRWCSVLWNDLELQQLKTLFRVRLFQVALNGKLASSTLSYFEFYTLLMLFLLEVVVFDPFSDSTV